MSNVIIIGGHGKVARLLAPLLVANGHAVTAVIRTAEQVNDVERAGVSVVVADIESLGMNGYVDLLRGHDAVVWSAGAGGGSAERTYRIDRDSAILAMQAALKVGARRFVMVSWAESGMEHGVDESDDFYAYAQSKAIADAVLRDTGLEWTIVAPSRLTEGSATGGVDNATATGSVSRADVAAVIAQSLEDPESIGRTLRFNSGATPIPEFVHGVGPTRAGANM